MRNSYLNPQVGCVHGNRITECPHCEGERVELLYWQRRTDQLFEIVAALNLPVPARLSREGVARG